MYTEQERIEDAIIPFILIGICHTVKRKEPECGLLYDGLLAACYQFIAQCSDGQSRYHRDKMQDRLIRLGKKVTRYGERNNFSCRKMLLMCVGWGHSLLQQRAIVVSVKTNLWKEVKVLYREIRSAHDDEGDFDKVYNSAIKHAPRVHQIALEEGYFL